MNDQERRELEIWLHEALGNCAHFWTWATIGDMLRYPDDDRICKKCGIKAGGREHLIGKIEAPHYTGVDWPALADAMRQRGWMPVVKWVPDNVPNYGTPKPHKNMPRIICEMNWFGHHQRPPRTENPFIIHDQLESAETEGEAVCLCAKAALEAERVSRKD